MDKKDKAKGGGMPYFERDHWEKPQGDTKVANGKYASEMGNAEDLKESVNKLADYTRKNKMKY